MMNNIKMINDMELAHVAGGYLDAPLTESEKELANKMDEAFFNAVSTAWEVIKYAFDIYG